MPGPNPKPRATRQRANRTSTRANLPREDATWMRDRRAGKVPPLPNRGPRRGWHPRSRAYWNEIWRGPMREEYLKAHYYGLLELFELIDMRNKGGLLAADRLKLDQEIRMQQRDYGLTPMDMRRLQWEVDKGEEAQEKMAERKQRQAAKKAVAEAADPREVLRVVPAKKTGT